MAATSGEILDFQMWIGARKSCLPTATPQPTPTPQVTPTPNFPTPTPTQPFIPPTSVPTQPFTPPTPTEAPTQKHPWAKKSGLIDTLLPERAGDRIAPSMKRALGVRR
ncbi:MAG: hypothetical protein P8R42_04455 [Candidatus Binatia bacterium]|nr:hypothetical protein [Candidatus Binatia bacterium]